MAQTTPIFCRLLSLYMFRYTVIRIRICLRRNRPQCSTLRNQSFLHWKIWLCFLLTLSFKYIILWETVAVIYEAESRYICFVWDLTGSWLPIETVIVSFIHSDQIRHALSKSLSSNLLGISLLHIKSYFHDILGLDNLQGSVCL